MLICFFLLRPVFRKPAQPIPEITATPQKPPVKATTGRKRKFPTMTKAFFNTIAPGLSSFANDASTSITHTINEDDQDDTESKDFGPEVDPEVVATIADF